MRDVVEAYVLAINAPDFPRGTIFNLASGVPRRIGDALQLLLSMSEAAIVIKQDESLIRPSDVLVTTGDARRAYATLGWRPIIPWDQTLHDVLDIYRKRSV